MWEKTNFDARLMFYICYGPADRRTRETRTASVGGSQGYLKTDSAQVNLTNTRLVVSKELVEFLSVDHA